MLRPMEVKGILPRDVEIVLTFAVAAAVAMVATGIPPGDERIMLTFAATVAAAAIVGGGYGVRDIVALLGESYV